MSVAGPLGRYTVLRLLAKGGMADLLLARSSGVGGFERHVVIKRLREEEASDTRCVKMFVTEARLAGQLHHHNIIQVQDTGEENGRPYFAMEYVHGEDARRLLRKLRDGNQMPPFGHVIAIISAAATALHHAHEQKGPDKAPLNIVHRDVSPSNILVGYDGNVKVLDFGIAKAAIATVTTQSGTLKGKVPYMSPEQCTNRVVDRRSDVFSLGIVAYELCTVRRLFKGDTHFLTMSAIVHGTVPRPTKFRKDLPLALEKIIMKALARDPDDRYQSAEEFRAALESYATRAGMVGSPSALASYMKQVFGAQPEPWHVEYDEQNDLEAEADFDGTIMGLAEPPTELDAIPIPDDSPIQRARKRATTSSTVVGPAPQPPKPPLARADGAPPELKSVAGTIEIEAGDGDSTTAVSTPPPMPTVVTTPRMTENTMIVEPLEVPEDTGMVEARRTHKRWMIGGVIAAVGIAIAIAIVIGFSPDNKPEERKPIDLTAAAATPPPGEQPPPETKPVAEPPPAPPTKAEEPPAPPSPPIEPVVTPTTPPDGDVEIEMAPESSHAPAAKAATDRPVTTTSTKPPPVRPKPPVRTATTPKPPAPKPPKPPTTAVTTPKPPTTTTTTTTPPKWDPDALFPKKKP